jgi:hypothetical protein
MKERFIHVYWLYGALIAIFIAACIWAGTSLYYEGYEQGEHDADIYHAVNNAIHPGTLHLLRDYQLDIVVDTIKVYDGERFVGNIPFENHDALGCLIEDDNY